MTLEEEIKQVKFKSEQHKLMLNILFTASWFNRIQLCAMRDADITPPQYNILRILRGSKSTPMTLGDISTRMIDKSSNTSRLIDKLVAKNWVSREPNNLDRRQMQIQITDLGLGILDTLQAPVEETAEPFKKINVEDAKRFNTILDNMRINKNQNTK